MLAAQHAAHDYSLLEPNTCLPCCTPHPCTHTQVLTNAGMANAATGDQGYTDAVACAKLLADALKLSPDDILLQSTGETGGG